MFNDTMFRAISFGIFFLALLTSASFRARADRQGGDLSRGQGRGLVALLRGLSLLYLAPVFAYWINPDWLGWTRLPLPDGLRVSGIALGVLSIPLAYWTLSAIGQNITPTHDTRTDHQLVTSGPYRYIRHPLYSVGLLLLSSLFLMTGVWTIAGGFVPIAILLVRTRHEEANLVETFGEEYRAYQARTKRFIPFIY